MANQPSAINTKRAFTLLLSLIMALSLLAPLTAHAQEQKVVRVGWYESPFNRTGADGKRGGYAYEYQQKLAVYTGWTYEYVYGSWVELLRMLQNGEIDLMTDVSYTEERAQTMLYSDLPMGTENYYLYVASGDTGISAQDLSTLNGKKIGVNRGSYQSMLLKNWREEKGLSFEIIEDDLGDAESWRLVLDGTLDGYVSLDSYSSSGEVISRIGYSDFYFVMRPGSEELMTELNTALDAIQIGDRYYNQQLWDKYLGNQGASRFLSAGEVEWLNGHGTIRVGYRDGYMPFCGTDSESGEATGMLKEYLDAAAALFRNANLSFQLITYPSTHAAKDALKRGEIDCVFPVNMALSDAEDEGLIISDPVLESQMDLLVSKTSYGSIDLTGKVRIALIEGNTGFLGLISEYFPDCEIVYFADTVECFKGIARGEADGIIANPYQITSVSGYMDEYQLIAMDTDAISDMDFVLNAGDTVLYSILSKIRNLIPDSSIHNMIIQHTQLDTSTSFTDYIKANVPQVLAACALIAFVLVLLLLKSRRAEKAARLAEKLTNEANAEIQEVNTQLEEHQAQLEELTAEQESQIEEISLLNTELETARHAADAASSAKSRFLFNMSHDIRTPMNAIIGFTALIRKHQSEPDKVDDYLGKIESSSQFLLSLINNVLEMARIESGNTVLEETVWSSGQFIDALSSVFSEQMKRKGIAFTVKADIRHSCVYCDTVKLQKIFLNIISNAYKFTPAGGTVSMELKELPSEKEGCAKYQTTISDTGIGMSKEFLPHIFEEFTREMNATESKIEGTGLGMPIVRQLVELMGGTITVTSEPGRGTTFVVTIHHRIADESALKKPDSSDDVPASFAGKRILLAEDNDLNAEIAIEILSDAGFRVDRAEDGIICVDRLVTQAAGYYDVILMDIQMPNLNGYEATRRIRALSDVQKARIPILAMTANAFEEDKQNALAAGMNGHLAKPIDVPALMKALAAVLEPGRE